jgi:hypothetical protein
MNLFMSCKHIFGLDNLYIGELETRVEGRLGATNCCLIFKFRCRQAYIASTVLSE